jgi:uncharacterized protein (TIGR03084 family)
VAADLGALLADLTAETRVLENLLVPLDATDWQRPTPSPGWTIHDQVSHLAYFDETATLAATDPARFRAEAAGVDAVGPGFPDEIAARYRKLSAAVLLSWFLGARTAYVAALRGLDARDRLPWYGPDMSAASAVTARLMETWAHGQDVADALGVVREPTSRLRHVAHLGVRTFGFSFQLNGRPVPVIPVRVELAAPDAETWTWGPAEAPDRVTGPALDFCLVVTQRRNLADTGLRVTGPVAAEWMSLAQAFAGPPGAGREPGLTFPRTVPSGPEGP